MLDPPALKPSSSLERPSWYSPTLPGRNLRGRNEGVPVVTARGFYLCNGTLQANGFQLDCRGTKVPVLEWKTTVAVDPACVDQSERSFVETFVPSQGFDDATIFTNPRGDEDHPNKP